MRADFCLNQSVLKTNWSGLLHIIVNTEDIFHYSLYYSF